MGFLLDSRLPATTQKQHMSKTTEATKKKATRIKSPGRAEVGAAMFGRDILVEALEHARVSQAIAPEVLQFL